MTEDVDFEHKPHRLLGQDLRGKQGMSEGMTRYLGKNGQYEAELVNVALGTNVIALQYEGVHVFRRGGEGPVLTEHFAALQVLEIVDGKVSIIREFRE